MKIGPQKGPQEAFMGSRAEICIYSGQVGAGKTFALVNELGKWRHVPGYVGAAFRREYKQLVGGGSLWDTAQRTWPRIDSRVRMPEHKAIWPSGAKVEFHHLHLDSSKYSHDGKEYALIAFDELGHFEASQFWYLALLRNRSTCGVTPHVRATCMASPDTWLREFVRPWVYDDGWPNPEMSGEVRWMLRDERTDGVVWFESKGDAFDYDPTRAPKSVSVIHAKTADNKILLEANPGYTASLAAMTRVERLKLVEGNWEARPESAGMFDRSWFQVRDKLPEDMVRFSVRGWDKAATKKTTGTGLYSDDPDWTAGVRLDVLRNGEVVVSDVVAIQDRPDKVDALIKHTAELDGPKVTQALWVDPAQAGLVDEYHTRAILKQARGCGPVAFEKQTKRVQPYAAPIASYAGPDTPGGMSVVRGMWTGEFFAELEQFPLEKDVHGNKVHDDRVSAMARGWLEAKAYLKLERAGNPGAGWAEKMRTSRL